MCWAKYFPDVLNFQFHFHNAISHAGTFNSTYCEHHHHHHEHQPIFILFTQQNELSVSCICICAVCMKRVSEGASVCHRLVVICTHQHAIPFIIKSHMCVYVHLLSHLCACKMTYMWLIHCVFILLTYFIQKYIKHAHAFQIFSNLLKHTHTQAHTNIHFFHMNVTWLYFSQLTFSFLCRCCIRFTRHWQYIYSICTTSSSSKLVITFLMMTTTTIVFL